MKYTEFNSRPFETHMLVFDLIRSGSRVLDLGCASGYMARKLKEKNCSVTGVDNDKKALKLAEKHCDKTLFCNLERVSDLTLPERSFDYILALDVIEHLKNRGDFLLDIRKFIKKDGLLIISTPNIVHISVRIYMLLGKFNYTKYGILDESHLHFFTRKTLEEQLRKSKWEVEEVLYSSDFGQLPFLGRFARRLPKSFQHWITLLLPNLLGVQMIAICQPNRN